MRRYKHENKKSSYAKHIECAPANYISLCKNKKSSRAKHIECAPANDISLYKNKKTKLREGQYMR